MGDKLLRATVGRQGGEGPQLFRMLWPPELRTPAREGEGRQTGQGKFLALAAFEPIMGR